MAQLIQMRQKIRAIETIKKITHAMRLISMSSHSRMSSKIIFMQNYHNELLKVITILKSFKEDLEEKKVNSEKKDKKLIILVGSQKGLSGVFNSALFKFFENKIKLENIKNAEFISVGKKATDYLKKKYKPKRSFDNFNLNNVYSIAKEIFEEISVNNYENVVVYSNHPKSFFAQIPEKNVLIPVQFAEQSENSLVAESYIWEQSHDFLIEKITKEYIYFNLQLSLFNSLFAEQAARFNSMDSATRNADELLDSLKRQYNKIRQAKITKEISEISSAI